MLKEKYFNYKLEYKEYIILIKTGNFYIAIDNDALIMNQIFNYKIKESTNLIKIGFPICSLVKVTNELNNKKINYLIINDNNIIEKEKFKNNQYSNYNCFHNNFSICLSRINKINEILKRNMNYPKIDDILDSIEKLICMINY